jgi:hypothetical protein
MTRHTAGMFGTTRPSHLTNISVLLMKWGCCCTVFIFDQNIALSTRALGFTMLLGFDLPHSYPRVIQ